MKPWKILIAIALVLSLAACRDKDTKKVPSPRLAKVITVPKPVDINTRYFPGRVEANQRVNLSFQVSGRVIKFPVFEGTELKKG